MSKIIGVYRITNTVTNDFYIGSSNDVKRRWADHKKPSVWKNCSNSQMYLDMKKYGTDKFSFEVLEEVEVDKLKEVEQKFIETLKPTYNDRNADGLNIERQKKYQQSDKYKESNRKASNKYENQLCYYNNEVLTLATLSMRFIKAGIDHPTQEAKKYLIRSSND